MLGNASRVYLELEHEVHAQVVGARLLFVR